MATTFTGGVNINVSGVLAASNNIGSALSNNLAYIQNPTFANGTAINQANEMWADTRTLTASSTESLDLSGSLTDSFGASLVFTRIKGIIVHAAAANTNNVLIGGAASNGFINWISDATDIVVVRPGGTFCLLAPDATAYAITAGTGDILKVANSSSGTSVTYDIILIGTV